MNQKTGRMFTGREAAVAYAISAERMFGGNADFLEANTAVVPIFVSLLCQSLEISIKRAGIESGLFTEQEVKARPLGHHIKELASLAVEKLGGEPFDPIVMAITSANKHMNSAQIVREMICGDKFEKTRDVYASRDLGYEEVFEGDFAIIYPIADWIASVKETAVNLPTSIDILSQWKASASTSKHFAIWFCERHRESVHSSGML